MVTPLSSLRSPSAAKDVALGQHIAAQLAGSTNINSLLDCLCSTPHPAVFCPDISRSALTHEQLRAFVSTFVLPHSSSRTPLGPNDRVLIALPSGPVNAVALLSVACYHTCAPVNASCMPSELRDDAKKFGAKLVLASKDSVERLGLESLQEDLGCDVVLVEPLSSGPAGLFKMECLNRKCINPRKPSRLQRLDDQALLLQTSGTSGKKKVVPYSLRSIIIGAWAVVLSWELRESDVNLNMMPLFHVGGIVRNLYAPILSGGSTVVCDGFDPIEFWRIVIPLKVTWYYGAPTIHHAILSSQPDSVDAARDLNIRMICNAAGGLLPSLAVEMKKVYGNAIILPSYGMTECMPIASPPQNYELERPGCSGLPCGPEVSIRDPINREREMTKGATGAVAVRGFPTFAGYEVSPDKNVPLDTSCFSKEGWFDTGDMGYMDHDGYLYITGRSKEIINKGGEVISPFEIEEAILTATKGSVKSTLAFAVEHDVLQEAVGVVIVCTPGKPRIGLHQLQDALRDYLHPSKWPSVVVYMDDLPKNSTGKTLRINLAKRLGLPRFQNGMSALRCHFEAEVPSLRASPTEAIPCSAVSFSTEPLDSILARIREIKDHVFNRMSDGSVELFLALDPEPPLNSEALKAIMSREAHGYLVPEAIYLLSGSYNSLSRFKSGEADFDEARKDFGRLASSTMSGTELKIRNLVSELLDLDTANITSQSDFFLLGGSSLLLGKLAYKIRKETGAQVGVSTLFNNCTIAGMAALVDSDLSSVQRDLSRFSHDGTDSEQELRRSTTTSTTALAVDSQYDYGTEYKDFKERTARGQNHPMCLVVQAVPLIFFYPLKAALMWSLLLFFLSYITEFLGKQVWFQLGTLLAVLLASQIIVRVVCPLSAILFKWLVVGKYKPGTYRMWSSYYLRCWIVEQFLRSSGKGVFGIHSSLSNFYYRMLGAKIGKNVIIEPGAKLGEYDLLTFRDGCRIDKSHIRGFCVEREGNFRLDKITIGKCAVINTFTTISPGAVIPDRAVYGPHASSHDPPSSKSYAAYNRTLFPEPFLALQVFVAWPLILLVIFVSYVPWLFFIWLMLENVEVVIVNLNALGAVIQWFSEPRRVLFHVLSRIARELFTPILQVVLGIALKRLLGLNRECSSENFTQLMLLRRYINSILLSREALHGCFSILGAHYEVVSIAYRAMGAKIGERIYWPGSGIYCPDPELLEIGDDVVFGSRSEVFTSDRLAFKKVVIGPGAMIADRVVLLPGAHIGRKTVMGSGALGKRDGVYEDGSIWMGSKNGEAISFGKSERQRQDEDTVTPFGRAFYQGDASYWVYPYVLILAINLVVTAIAAVYWSLAAIVTAQILEHLRTQLHLTQLFKPTWFRLAILYSLIALSFIIILSLQALLVILWTIFAKWLVIGKRREGVYRWDESDYCQRWQLHLTLSRILYKGYGIGGILGHLNGTAYIVWFYRALGARIGKNCAIFAGGISGLMTEPDLVRMGDNVSTDNCSIVAHLNSRGVFVLNKLSIQDGCALRSGSRLLSGASMEGNSMLREHTLLVSGDIAEVGCCYTGWPVYKQNKRDTSIPNGESPKAQLICPLCCQLPQRGVVTPCGHLFCERCIKLDIGSRHVCPVCRAPSQSTQLRQVWPSFVISKQHENL